MSDEWVIRKQTKDRLQKDLKKLYSAFDDAERLFSKLGRCKLCITHCCVGGFNRVTVFDRITHLVEGIKQPPKWGYRLYPLGSFMNPKRSHKRNCDFFTEGRGCSLSYYVRPAMCVWSGCSKIGKVLSREERNVYNRIKREVFEVHWSYALKLLFGGMTKKGEF